MIACVAAGSTGVAQAGEVTTADLIKLAQAEVGDDLILAFLESNKARLDLSADDLVALREAGLSDKVLSHILESAAKGDSVEPGPDHGMSSETASTAKKAQSQAESSEQAPPQVSRRLARQRRV